MRVLVTGASGVVGRWAVPALVRAGHDVHAVRRGGDHPAPTAGVTQHAADLLVAGDRLRLVRESRPDAVLHLAWETTHGRFWESENNADWVAATVDLVAASLDGGSTRVVVAGTCAEYDWHHLDGDCDELTTPTSPRSAYGRAKLETLERLSSMPGDGGWLGWGRLFSMYGPGEASGRLVPSLVNALIRGRPAVVAHPSLIRDFLHAGRVAQGLVALLGSPVSGAVNVASGQPLRLGDLAQQLATLVGRPELLRLSTAPPAATDPGRLVASTARLRDEVGFQPEPDLTEDLRNVVRWWKEHRVRQPD